jgi:hypothetical protein
VASGEAAIRTGMMHSPANRLESIVTQYLCTGKLHCLDHLPGALKLTKKSKHEGDSKETPSQPVERRDERRKLKENRNAWFVS